MKVPKKRSILHKLPAAAALLLLVCTVFLTGCGKEEEGQRYAYPLATASPEDTVTQIYAEKFAKEGTGSPTDGLKFRCIPTPLWAGTGNFWNPVRTATFLLWYRTRHPR